MKHNKVKNWIFFTVISLAVFLPVVGQAGTISLPRTGQTKCYDAAGTEITCAGTGQDGEIRAGVACKQLAFFNCKLR